MYAKHTPLMLFLIVTLILTGCSFPAQVTPVPTADSNLVAQTVSAVQTEAVQTAYAQMTQTFAAMPTMTSTPVPTDTAVPTATATATSTATTPPTATFAPPTATFIPATLAPSLTFTPSAYQCSITSLAPASGVKINKGGDFDLNVTFKNSGTTAWNTADIDFLYISGVKFQESVSVLDLPKNVAPGETVQFIVDMVANSDTGRQTAVWGLNRLGNTFCSFTIAVQVE